MFIKKVLFLVITCLTVRLAATSSAPSAVKQHNKNYKTVVERMTPQLSTITNNLEKIRLTAQIIAYLGLGYFLIGNSELPTSAYFIIYTILVGATAQSLVNVIKLCKKPAVA